jgi:hypothetical protein
MQALFDGGHVVDLILLLMLVEAAALAVVRARRGTGLPLTALLPNLLAGACLLLALRAALTDSGVFSVSAWLTLGFVAHLTDLASRWRSAHRAD